MRSNSHFGYNTPTFICTMCDRLTRDTGQGVDHLCGLCYDICGQDNSVNDNNFQKNTPEFKGAFEECERLLAMIAKKNGNVEKVKAANEFIFGDALEKRAARRAKEAKVSK